MKKSNYLAENDPFENIVFELTILTVQQGLQDEDLIPIYTCLDKNLIHQSPESDDQNIKKELLRGLRIKVLYSFLNANIQLIHVYPGNLAKKLVISSSKQFRILLRPGKAGLN